MNVALILMAACTVPSQAGLPDMTVAQIEERILASRRQIRRGRLSFEWSSGDQKGKLPDRPFTVWFDHDKGKNRTDSTVTQIHRQQKIEAVEPFRRIECRNCERPDHYVRYDEVRFENGSRTVLQLSPLKQGEKLPLFDPRLIGFIPVNPEVLWHHDLETVLGKGDRSNQTLRQDRLGGVGCYVIAFDIKGKRGQQRYEYWAAPSKDYSLLRVSVTNTFPDHVGQGLVENELARFGPGDVWFPRTSTYTESRDGKVGMTAKIQVKSAEFNGPTDVAPFTLAGMSLRDGVVVAAKNPNGTSKTYTWKGQKLVDHVNPQFVMPKQLQTGTRWWLYGVAGVLAALALGAFGLYWRRRVAIRSLPETP